MKKVFHSTLNKSVEAAAAAMNIGRFGSRYTYATTSKIMKRLRPLYLHRANLVNGEKSGMRILCREARLLSSGQGSNDGGKITASSAMDLLGSLEEENEFDDEKPLNSSDEMQFMSSTPIQEPAGKLYEGDNPSSFIPQVPLNEKDFQRKARVLVLCTGGTVSAHNYIQMSINLSTIGWIL